MELSVADSGIMLRTIVLVVFAISGSQGSPVESPSVNHHRIVNGWNVTLGEFPSQLSLQVYGKHKCGASILSEDFALTTASCVKGIAFSTITLVAGTVNLLSGGKAYKPTQIFIHGDYDEFDSHKNDISLLWIYPAKFPIDHVTVAPINLPKQGDFVPDGAVVTVIGWGRQKEDGDYSNVLLKTELVVTRQEICEYLYGRIGHNIYPSHICADVPEGNKGPCDGDEGGPLIIGGQVVGLASWGRGCASSGFPAVYTRVAEYRDWINRIMRTDNIVPLISQ